MPRVRMLKHPFTNEWLRPCRSQELIEPGDYWMDSYGDLYEYEATDLGVGEHATPGVDFRRFVLAPLKNPCHCGQHESGDDPYRSHREFEEDMRTDEEY